GTCLIGSEETEILDRMARAGGNLLYEPAAVVGHRVPLERLRRRWFWSRCFWGSRGDARMMGPSDVSWTQLMRWTWRIGLASRDLCWSAATHGLRSPKTFDKITLVAKRSGTWVGLTSRLMRRGSAPE